MHFWYHRTTDCHLRYLFWRTRS